MYNCKKNVQLPKKWHNCIIVRRNHKKIITTAKKMAQLQNKMYICEKNAQLRNTLIAVVIFLAKINLE